MLFHCTSPLCLLVTCSTLWRTFLLLSTLLSCSSGWCEQGSATGEPLFKLVVCQVKFWLSWLSHPCSWVLSVHSWRHILSSLPGWWFQCWPWEMLLVAGLPVNFRLLSSLWTWRWLGANFPTLSYAFCRTVRSSDNVMEAKQEQLFHVSVKNWELEPEIARDLYYFSVKRVCSAFLRNHILLKCLGLATRVPFRGLDSCSQINIYFFRGSLVDFRWHRFW